MKKIKFLLAIILCSGCCVLTGCLESSFQLSDQSRLPVWVKLPPTVTRQDVSVTLNYYTTPFGTNAKLIVSNRRGDLLQKMTGPDKPIENASGEVRYPSYVLVVVNDVPEVIEHRAQEPIFYVCDDPRIRERILHNK